MIGNQKYKDGMIGSVRKWAFIERFNQKICKKIHFVAYNYI